MRTGVKARRMLKVGSPAPELELIDQFGESFRLSQLRGKYVVLFFYPKANTSVCTKEACSFRDHFEEFAAKDTEVVGVSHDPQHDQFRFAQRWNLPFRLLCDTENTAAKAFGVTKWLGLMSNRVTFVIDRSGRIRSVIEARFHAERHVREALAALDQRKV
jgi:thioredoxin-dependent peroxiredoxin